MRLGGFGNVHRADFHRHATRGVIVEANVESTLRSGELARLFKFACSDRFAPKAIAKQRKGKTPSDNVWGASGVATSVRHLDFFSARIPTGLSVIFLARPFQTTKSVLVLTSRYRAKSSDLRFSGTTREIHQAVP
jgi:hypothetical protein